MNAFVNNSLPIEQRLDVLYFLNFLYSRGVSVPFPDPKNNLYNVNEE